MPLLFNKSTFFAGLAAVEMEEDEGVAPPTGELLGVVASLVFSISAPITELPATSGAAVLAWLITPGLIYRPSLQQK